VPGIAATGQAGRGGTRYAFGWGQVDSAEHENLSSINPVGVHNKNRFPAIGTEYGLIGP
jgi:hypothetical protein